MHDISTPNLSDFKWRNSLLQSTLRPFKTEIPITLEYPIVLHPDQPSLSYCVHKNSRPIAHANLWPRSLVTQDGKELGEIGLIGNVASHPEYRGLGLVRNLMDHFKNIAKQKEFKALILWSDLDQFYQNLGFKSWGNELRFTIPNHNENHATLLNPQDLSEETLQTFLDLRPKTPLTLKRSLSEFHTLMQIPFLRVYALCDETTHQVKAFAAMNRGYDFLGVIHEWGAEDAKSLISLLKSIPSAAGLEEVTVLSPCYTSEMWLQALRSICSAESKHPMAYGWSHNETNLEDLATTFIWGFDSI